jgi:hypothetical protein
VTLRDAADCIMKLPKSKQQSPEWQAAGEAVMMAAEDRGPLMHLAALMKTSAIRPMRAPIWQFGALIRANHRFSPRTPRECLGSSGD